MDELVNDWKVSRDFTLAVAEKMPAEFYGFKPTTGERSFGEQMAAPGGSRGFPVPPAHGRACRRQVKLPGSRTIKRAVMEFVKFGFDDVIGLLPKITPPQLTRQFKVDWKGRAGSQWTRDDAGDVRAHGPPSRAVRSLSPG